MFAGNIAFLGNQERSSHPNSNGPKRQRCSDAPAIADASRRNDGDRNRIDDIRKQRKIRNSPHMAAGLQSLGNEEICAGERLAFSLLRASG